MSSKNPILMKTCSHCGEQKPLSAFLQLTGPQGTSYSTVCFACRKAYNEKAALAKESSDEVTTSRTGVKIDSKTKVKGEIDKREHRKQQNEQDLDEREKKVKFTFQQTEKKQHIAHDEKKHRKDYIEKRSFLDTPKKTIKTGMMVFGGEDQKAKARSLEFDKGPVDYARTPGEKTKSVVYQAFKSWLGNSAPIVSAAERAAKQKNNAPGTPEKTDNDPLNEYVNKNFRPKSGK